MSPKSEPRSIQWRGQSFWCPADDTGDGEGISKAELTRGILNVQEKLLMLELSAEHRQWEVRLREVSEARFRGSWKRSDKFANTSGDILSGDARATLFRAPAQWLLHGTWLEGLQYVWWTEFDPWDGDEITP